VRCDWKVSIRRACSGLRIDRALYVYKSKSGDEAALKLRIRDIGETRMRYGYRRVRVLLQRDGWATNVSVYRLYRQLSPQLRDLPLKHPAAIRVSANVTPFCAR
jgi:putative transposase